MSEEVKTKTAEAKAPKETKAADAKAAAPEEGAKKARVKKSKRRSVPEGHLYIKAGYNNTIVSVTEPNGNVIAWATSGSCGFKGTRKSTPYAAQVAAETATEKAKAFGLERVHVFINGAGPGREQAVRGISATGVSVESISDTTTAAHGGCTQARPRKV